MQPGLYIDPKQPVVFLFLLGEDCNAYIGALLPLVTALVYLNIAATIKGFGAATALNGFIFVLFLIAGEADTSYIIGTIVLSVPAIHVAILALRWAEKVLEKQTAELK